MRIKIDYARFVQICLLLIFCASPVVALATHGTWFGGGACPVNFAPASHCSGIATAGICCVQTGFSDIDVAPGATPGTPGSSPVGGEKVLGDGKISYKNPITTMKADTVPEFLLALVRLVTLITAPLIVLFIIYAGWLFVTAAGDEGQRTKARHALLWTLIGAGVLIGALILGEILKETINSLK